MCVMQKSKIALLYENFGTGQGYKKIYTLQRFIKTYVYRIDNNELIKQCAELAKVMNSSELTWHTLDFAPNKTVDVTFTDSREVVKRFLKGEWDNEEGYKETSGLPPYESIIQHSSHSLFRYITDIYTEILKEKGLTIGSLSLEERLCNKISYEMEVLYNSLFVLKPEEILQKAYEYSTKRDIQLALKNTSFNEEKTEVLLKMPEIVSVIYDYFLREEDVRMSEISGCIEKVIKDYSKRNCVAAV